VNEYDNPLQYKGGETLLLTGFDLTTKYNGFYRLKLDSKKKVEKLIMSPNMYYIMSSQLDGDASRGKCPVKAGQASAYIVERQSSTEAPNYFFTHNFNQFSQLTNVHRKVGIG
jgi:hypothetical protein